MAFRDQLRRPLVLILLVLLPAYVVFRSIAIPSRRRVGHASRGTVIASTMRDVHGAVMAGNVIAFVAGLIGVFVMQSALQGDRRLVIAGFKPGEAISARLIVMAAATGSSSRSRRSSPRSASASPPGPVPRQPRPDRPALRVDRRPGGSGARPARRHLPDPLLGADRSRHRPEPDVRHPPRWRRAAAGLRPGRVMVDGASPSGTFHGGGDLLLSIAWLSLLGTAVSLLLRRAVGASG